MQVDVTNTNYIISNSIHIIIVNKPSDYIRVAIKLAYVYNNYIKFDIKL